VDVLLSEDGMPANRYISQHRLNCGGRVIELRAESPVPVKLSELKDDGKTIPAAQLQAMNAQGR